MKSAREAFNQGSQLMRDGKPREAERYFLQALEHDPDLAGAHHNLGFIYYQRQNFDSAAMHLKHSDRLNPDQGRTHFLLGAVLAQSGGQSEEAIAAYERALELDPSLSSVHPVLGVLFYQTGQWERAVEHLEKAVEMRPGVAQLLFILGLSYVQAGQEAYAVDVVTRLRALDEEFQATRLEQVLRNAGSIGNLKSFEPDVDIEVPEPPAPPRFQSTGQRVTIQGNAQVNLQGAPGEE